MNDWSFHLWGMLLESIKGMNAQSRWSGLKLNPFLLDIKQTRMLQSRMWGLAVPLLIIIARAGDPCAFDPSTYKILFHRESIIATLLGWLHRFEDSGKPNFLSCSRSILTSYNHILRSTNARGFLPTLQDFCHALIHLSCLQIVKQGNLC